MHKRWVGIGVTALLALGAPAQRADASVASEVRAAARAHGFGAIAERLGRAGRPTVMVGRSMFERAPRRLGLSRMGGAPDLPPAEHWPRCKAGRLSFLAQIRLRDLPPAARPLRRHRGLLLVFTHVEFEPGETHFGLWGGRCSRVLHVPDGTRLERRRPPRGQTLMRLRPARLHFRARPDIPDIDDYGRAAPPLRDVVSEWEPWFRLRQAVRRRPGSLEHRLLGYMDAPNGGNRCFERTRRRTHTWRHLVTIGSDLRTRFEVADAGRLQLAISPRDLRRGRFDRVCGVFDSA